MKSLKLLSLLLAATSVGFFICSVWMYHKLYFSPVYTNNFRTVVSISNNAKYQIEPDIVFDERNYTFHQRVQVIDIPHFRVKDVNCAKLFQKEYYEMARARMVHMNRRNTSISVQRFITRTSNCTKYLQKRHYILHPLSADEATFPIAFGILIFKDIEQFERLLRAIYRPQNYYCIHVDAKSPVEFHRAAASLAGCFDNVIISSRSVDVVWGEYSVLEADLICMEDLWTRFKRWRYFINLTGQEFPLKTNGDIVKILRAYAGANNIEGTVERIHPDLRTGAGTPPDGLQLTKGSVHITASRGYVNYVLHHPIALKLRRWIGRTLVPDEFFFSTLNHNPQLGVPGSYRGIPETDTRRYLFLTRFKNWGDYPFNFKCSASYWVRQVCIFSVGDLMLLASRPELFANKFYLDYEPLALDCMEELHYNKTRDELSGARYFDTSFYKNMDFVQNRVM